MYLDKRGLRLPPVTTREQNKNMLLVIVCLAQFMVILDVSIVNVALPKIGDSLSFSTTGLEWVVNAYTLTFSGLLMLGGRAADLLGRRRVFLSGVGLLLNLSRYSSTERTGTSPTRPGLRVLRLDRQEA